MRRFTWSRAAVLAVAWLWTGCAALVPMRPAISSGGRAVAASARPGAVSQLVVASESGGLYRSTDGGATWSQVSRDGTFWFNDVKHLPLSPGVVLAAASSDTRVTTGGGLWRSTDGGATWAQVALTPPTPACASELSAYALAPEAGRARVWAGTSCGLAFSDDAGATWAFQPARPGFAPEPVLAVVAPSPTQLAVLTGGAVRVSSDAGATWSSSGTGLPFSPVAAGHAQLAVSPRNARHLFWAHNAWEYVGGDNPWVAHTSLFASWDFGATWTSLRTGVGINRPPFVKAAGTPTDATYDVYFGDGGCTLARATVTHGTTPTLGAWSNLSVDHCDAADVAFDPGSPRTPVLVVSDGGLHRSADGGATWTLAGAGTGGYNALQVTEVTGQLHPDRRGADLYFGTQDNSNWASGDTGATWVNPLCCEGFFLNVWREPLSEDRTRVTGVTCAGCSNFSAGRLLTGVTGWPNPPNDAGNPRLLRPGSYIQNTALPGLSASLFNLSTDTGATWTPRYGFPEAALDLSRPGGASPVVYTAVKVPGATPDGFERVGIKRIAGVLGGGSPMVSDVGGLGSLGIFPTMFAWYKPFGVDPRDDTFLLAADVVDDTMKVSTDGGGTWTADAPLTQAVTRAGTFKFKWGPVSQASAYGFDPDCPGHILVGTQQAGVVRSFDRGRSWAAVEGSEVIPAVSSFFFPGNGKVVISSYGGSLWRLGYKCPRKRPDFVGPLQTGEPTIYWKGARVPLSQIKNPDVCPVCGYFFAQGGDVVDVAVDAATGKVREVVLSAGTLQGLTWDRQPVQPTFQVRVGAVAPRAVRGEAQGGQAPFGGDEGLQRQLKEEGVRVKGLYVDEGVLEGYVLAKAEVTAEQLPKRAELGARVAVELPQPSAPLGARRKPIVVVGAGFVPDRPVTVAVDGRPVQVDVKVDGQGNLRFELPPTFTVGGHTVLVEQKTERGVVRDAATFVLTVADDKERRQR